MSEPKVEICPVCSVRIEDNAKVCFSTGKPGTRERLWARVCNFAKNPNCINQEIAHTGTFKEDDYYK